MGQEAIFEISVEVTGVEDEVWVLFEEVNPPAPLIRGVRGGLIRGVRSGLIRGVSGGLIKREIGVEEVRIYFVNSKEVFPFGKLRLILDDFGVKFFGDAVKRDAVVGGADEFLFEPEAFLEFFDVREEVCNLGGDAVNEFRCFKPIVTIC